MMEHQRSRREESELHRALEVQRHLFQTVIETAPAGIAVFDGQDLRVKWANLAYRQFLEEPYRNEEITGRSLQEIVPGAEETGLADLFRQVAATGQPYSDPEYRYVGFARGATYWSGSVLPLLLEKGGAPDVMVLMGEVTEQVQARQQAEGLAVQVEAERARLEAIIASVQEAEWERQGLARELQEKNELLIAQNEELQAQSEEIQSQAEELRAQKRELEEADQRKDEFLAMLSHELRNPLGALSNAVEMVCLRGGHDSICGQVHGVLKRQVQYMTRLLDDLLDVSRIVRGKLALRKEPVDLVMVVSHAVETTRLYIEARRHELQLSLPSEPVRLEADPTRLEQILANLLNNAAKYTEPGGQIGLGVARMGSQAVLRVRDSGVGIPPELLPRIFDLFMQADRSTDRSQGGLGVGLALVRSLVEMHGGKVEAYSAGPGKGSEFVVRLPMAESQQKAANTATRSLKADGLQPKRVLVVDDNVDAARMMALLLEMWGHQVQVTHDGPAALDAARGYHPEVVLLDLGLPGMDGYEVARRLRQQSGLSGAFLVALTGYGHEEARRRSRESGFDQHLVKPVGADDLQQLLVTASRGL